MTTVVTTRLDDGTLAKLERLATHHDRSRAWLVAEAVRRYVEEEVDFLDFVQEGADAIERGDYLTQEEMEAWFAARRQSIAAE